MKGWTKKKKRGYARDAGARWRAETDSCHHHGRTRECVCVRTRCDISFLPNSHREVEERDNRHCWADGRYKSPWLNLWMIGIRGARGRMCVCAPGSDPAFTHPPSDDTGVLEHAEPGSRRGDTTRHSHKAAAMFHDVDLLHIFSVHTRSFFPLVHTSHMHVGLLAHGDWLQLDTKTMHCAVMVWACDHSAQTEDATY